jgi:predicted transcriptional regulator
MAKKTISKKTGPGSEQFQLRLPDGMRKQLARVAERNGRSMNAEIVTALANYFENEDASPPASRPRWPVAAESKGYRVDTAIKDLVDQIAEQHRELVRLIKKSEN